jgi:hypothetical protein
MALVHGHDGRTFHVFNMWDEEVSLAWENTAGRDDAVLFQSDAARELARLLIAAADEIDSAERDVD